MSKENRVSDERLAEIADEYSDMASKLTGKLADGPGAASAFYMTCSLGEIASMAEELQSLRSKPVAGVEVNPELLAATSSLQDISFRANELGIGLAKYPVAEIEAVLQFVSHALSTLSLPAQEPTAYGVFLTGGRFMDIASDSRDDAIEMAEIHYVQDDYLIRPLYASPQPEAVITEEMVERAASALAKARGVSIIDEVDQFMFRRDARAALTAAMKEA